MNGLSSVVSHWRVLLRMVIRLSDYRCVAFCIERMMIYAPRTYFSLFPFFFSYRLRAKLVCTSNIWDINSHIIRSYLNKSYFKISLDSTRQVKREYLKKSNATTTIPWRYESHRISITRISSRLLLQLDFEENASNNSSNGK